MDTTYRLVELGDDRQNVGRTAATPELAKVVPGDLYRSDSTRLAIEQTEWVEKFDKMVVNRSIIIEAEDRPGEWNIGI